jgi:hypothetical protein
MSNELIASEKIVEEVLIDLMTERVMSMSIGIQASLMRGVQTSPSNSCGSGPSRPTVEKRTKHIDNLANVNLIPSILPNYILPLVGMVSHDSVLRYFENTIITMYLPKGICAVRVQKDKITTLKFSDFNLGDRKNHVGNIVIDGKGGRRVFI